MPKAVDTYRDRYVMAVRIVMAENKIETYREVADELGINHLTLSAIISKRQMPTAQHCIDICNNYGFSANWLFLGKGERLQKEQATLDHILRAIQKL